jgi:xanthine phosphoribosyltransferase
LKRYYYSNNQFLKDINKLYNRVKNEDFDAIIGVSRGGLSLAQMIAYKLNIRDLFTINSISYDKNNSKIKPKIYNIPNLKDFNKILILDDIIDSGDTLYTINKILYKKYPKTNFKIATIFYKETSIINANYSLYKTNDWIEFFWENL